MARALICAGLIASIWQAAAQTVPDYAVQLSAVAETNPVSLELSWPGDPQASGYTVYRKIRDAGTWTAVTSLPGTATNYSDRQITLGNTYEYRVSKSASGYSGEGYLYGGVQAPLVDSRGKVILLVDAGVSTALAVELARLQQDLAGDGWTVLRHDVASTSSVPAVKKIITTDYSADPANVRSLFLFGHVPVPYSGNFAPDGHPEHVGAWPADVYYGDVDGTWTDSSVNVSTASYSRNWNVPGDGKFDPSSLPSDVELQVGRVDLSGLPQFTLSEVELLRQYLNKDHQFRFKQVTAQTRALVDDNFGTFNGEAFAASGWRNFGPLVGASSTVAADWLSTLATQSYLWAYGCGGGTYTSASGVGTTADLAAGNPQVVFVMLFGSYFGDWDSGNDFLRAPLATPGYTLASVWSGRPYWLFHHMALGETIGFSARVTQNNSSLYSGNRSTRGVHIALMGDPTLRMQAVAPPGPVAVTNRTGGTDLSWSAATDAVVGYHVYGGASMAGPFTRLTATPTSNTRFTDTQTKSSVYMVRSVKLEVGSSGSYYNASQGVFGTVGGAVTASATRLTIQMTAGNSFCISGTGIPGASYAIQCRNGLATGTWQTIGTVMADASGAFKLVDTPGLGQRSYRAVGL